MVYKWMMLVMGCVLAMLMASAARAENAEDARKFADDLGKQALHVINGQGSESQKQDALKQMFADNVDMDWMGRFVIGRGWQQASEEQRRQYLDAYKQYLLARYTTNFTEYAGSKYVITGVRDDGNGQFTVDMQIKSPNGQQQNTLAGYRLRADRDGKFKIADIIIEGVSLITTQRSDFSSVLQQKGVSGLIAAIEAKTQAEKKSASAAPLYFLSLLRQPVFQGEDTGLSFEKTRFSLARK